VKIEINNEIKLDFLVIITPLKRIIKQTPAADEWRKTRNKKETEIPAAISYQVENDIS